MKYKYNDCSTCEYSHGKTHFCEAEKSWFRGHRTSDYLIDIIRWSGCNAYEKKRQTKKSAN